MTYTENTTKEQIANNLKSTFIVLKDENFAITILKDDDSNIVLFQIRFYNKSVTLNELLTLGLAQYNPNISTGSGKDELLITFYINKL